MTINEKDLTFTGRTKHRQQTAQAISEMIEIEIDKANEFLKNQGVKPRL